MSTLIETLAYRLSNNSRARKFNQFLSLVAPKKDDTIIDVGINATEYSIGDNYLEKFYPYPEMITAVGQDNISIFAKRYPKIRSVSGDGLSLPFHDNEFTIGYSNAVLEHVGSSEQQILFLRELYRVSTRGYLTTPNKTFPIEIHTRIPLLHLLLPQSLFDIFLRFIGKSWATGTYMHLLNEKELRTLLDKASLPHYSLIKNRFLGFTLTFTIIWKKN